MGIFEQWKIKREKPKESQPYFEEIVEPSAAASSTAEETKEEVKVNTIDKHPFGGYLSKLVSLTTSLTYR